MTVGAFLNSVNIDVKKIVCNMVKKYSVVTGNRIKVLDIDVVCK